MSVLKNGVNSSTIVLNNDKIEISIISFMGSKPNYILTDGVSIISSGYLTEAGPLIKDIGHTGMSLFKIKLDCSRMGLIGDENYNVIIWLVDTVTGIPDWGLYHFIYRPLLRYYYTDVANLTTEIMLNSARDNINNNVNSRHTTTRTTINNNTNSKATEIINNDDANKLEVMNEIQFVQYSDELNRDAVINNDNANKDLIIGNTNTKATEIINNDNANKDLIIGNIEELNTKIETTYLGNMKLEAFYCETIPTPNPRGLFVGCEDYTVSKIKNTTDSDWSDPIHTFTNYYWYDENQKVIKFGNEE